MDANKILVAKIKVELAIKELDIGEKLELLYLIRKDLVKEMGGNL